MVFIYYYKGMIVNHNYVWHTFGSNIRAIVTYNNKSSIYAAWRVIFIAILLVMARFCFLLFLKSVDVVNMLDYRVNW